MEIFKEFTFDAAHFLPHTPEGHKCRRLHGHTYRIRIFCSGDLGFKEGWVVDFASIKKAWKPVEIILDHNLLNDIPGLENPTAELIAVWVWNKLKTSLPMISKIELFETPTCAVIYRGD
jgi:6-pyruvoyltetrahydropterin/6-carboxytetrahydropterin synthase